MSETTLVVPTDEPIDTTDKLEVQLKQYREYDPDTFIVELGDIDGDTKRLTVLPYALGYMESAGYGLVDIEYNTENEKFTFAKVKDVGETVEESSDSTKFKKVQE